jgi:RNA polymerase sigma-70 factor (ECF subfamily)
VRLYDSEEIFVGEGQRTAKRDTEQLVKASQAGDRGAFDELVLLYQRCAMCAAVRILGNAEEAAETVQNGFVNAYLNIGKLKDAEQFEIWLLRIVTNAAISQARKAKRNAQKITIDDSLEDKKVLSPVESESSEELKEKIKQAMLKLSKKEAKAISLFGLEDLSHKKVAEIMGCSVEAVRWHVFRARQKLKVLLKDYL